MVRRLAITTSILLLILSLTLEASERGKAVPRKLKSVSMKTLRPSTTLATADTCAVYSFGDPYWAIDQWLVGDEIYKAYIDPTQTCSNPYPFSVTEVHMYILFNGATPLTYGGDVESIDHSNPSCPLPDTLLGISDTYQDEVPSADIYDVWIDFDPPVVVNGPFFAGFYIGADLDPDAGASIVTDSIPELCNSYNVWDDSIGWVDLVSNDYYDFPGRLCIYAVGYTGGSTTQPPVAQFSASSTQICSGGAVGFTNLSTGGITSVAWNFGDGGTSTALSPAHVYATAGSYTVTLTATGPGGSDTETKANYITVSGSPTAAFIGTPLNGSAPLTVTFTNQSTQGTSWVWGFGDGGSSIEQHPTHQYTVAGTYTVTLVASNSCGNNVATRENYVVVSGSSSPAPQLTWLSHQSGDTILGNADLWVAETSGSPIIEYVQFDYSTGGSWLNIAADFDGSLSLRNGAAQYNPGTGFSVPWATSGRTEGTYQLRATAYDTLGRSGSATVSVYLEPTPPTPSIISPDPGDPFCNELAMAMTIPDENATYLEIYRRSAKWDYSAGVTTMTSSGVNCGPAAAALAAKVWADRGYAVMQAGSSTLTLSQLTDSLARRAAVSAHGGSVDELLFSAIRSYFHDHGDLLDIDYGRYPSYYGLRDWLEEQQRTVILGVSGAHTLWLAVDGFFGWPDAGQNWVVSLVNPLTGSNSDLEMRDNGVKRQIQYSGSWHDVDIMISMVARGWGVSRQLMGGDFNGADGWSYRWTPSGLSEDSLYFFRAVGHDAGGLSGASSVLLQYSCSSAYMAGDYNNDHFANILDLVYLADFLTAGGSAPVGGVGRADANGDGYVNIADVIYYMNYLFSSGSAPAH